MAGRRTGRARGRGPVAVAVVAVVALAGGVAGCGGSAPSEPTSDAASSVPGLDLLAAPDQVPVLARARLGEAPRLRRVTIGRDWVSLEVRDPARPENLDTYRYDARGWAAPSPVRVSQRDIDELDATTFGLGAVAWTAIPGLIARAYDGLDLEGEKVTSVSIDRLAGRTPRIYIGVDGLRGSGHLIANADGTGVEIRRD